jgi:hypothetical protein
MLEEVIFVLVQESRNVTGGQYRCNLIWKKFCRSLDRSVFRRSTLSTSVGGVFIIELAGRNGAAYAE